MVSPSIKCLYGLHSPLTVYKSQDSSLVWDAQKLSTQMHIVGVCTGSVLWTPKSQTYCIHTLWISPQDSKFLTWSVSLTDNNCPSPTLACLLWTETNSLFLILFTKSQALWTNKSSPRAKIGSHVSHVSLVFCFNSPLLLDHFTRNYFNKCIGQFWED